MGRGCRVPVPCDNTFDARPVGVWIASGGGALTSGGAGIDGVELVSGVGALREHAENINANATAITEIKLRMLKLSASSTIGQKHFREPFKRNQHRLPIPILQNGLQADRPLCHNRWMDLQQRAVELAKNNSFGTEALDVNLQITRTDPSNQGAWTRLARCYLEQRRFADAAGALATVLDLNPSNTIAKSLMTEVTKRRAMALPSAEAATGFTAHDFNALAHLAPVEAARALGPKIETLLLSLNDQRTAGRIVQLRNRAGESGSKLFHRNSYHDVGNGCVHAYHHGGRWEPQFGLGFLAGTAWGGNWMRIGLGFNMAVGRDDQLDGHERMVQYFEAFQQQLTSAWKRQLADWMGKAEGFIQYGDRGPAIDLLPQQAVEWLINCRNPAAQGWVFVGRWLSLAQPADAAILADMRQVVATVEDTFAALFTLWAAIYH